MELARFWGYLSRWFREMEPCEHGWAVLDDPSALEQHVQSCLPCRKLHAAQYLANNTLRYLRMEQTADGLKPRLYLSHHLPGYLRLDMPSLLPQVYAAGSVYRGERWLLQAVSDDARLLVTLRSSTSDAWELTARYLPGARWQADEACMMRPTWDAETPAEPPECLACLVIDYGENAVQARIGAWFVQENEAYVARLRLPLVGAQQASSRLEIGLIPMRALRWLTPEEITISQQCALNPQAQARWQSWRANYAR